MMQVESDPEIRELAKVEQEQLEDHRLRVESDLKMALVPTDPNDEKNVIIEIRAGTGGEDAGLFASELFRRYS